MEQIQIQGYVVEVDPEATRTLYAGAGPGGPERCGCGPCLAFARRRAEVYPEAFLALLRRCGVAESKEAEVCFHTDADADPLLLGGWFHAVGEVRAMPWPLVDGAGRYDAEAGCLDRYPRLPLAGTFRFGLHNDAAQALPGFEGRSLVQIEFTAELPAAAR